jgi:Fumarylacetoacetate (FAA) hydrolase family
MPVHVGDFTDFSCSRDHVLNAGEAVFGKQVLPPGFSHFPLGYGGRSSSVVMSGTPVWRPLGQYRSKTDPGVVEFGPSRELDYELELGCIIGKPVRMGDIPTAADADDHIFGIVLLDDWSGKCKSLGKCTATLTLHLESPRHTRPGDRPAGTTQRQELHDLDITLGSHLGRPQPIRSPVSSTG